MEDTLPTFSWLGGPPPDQKVSGGRTGGHHFASLIIRREAFIKAPSTIVEDTERGVIERLATVGAEPENPPHWFANVESRGRAGGGLFRVGWRPGDPLPDDTVELVCTVAGYRR